MTRDALPWHGGCRCGRVRLSVTKPPLLSMACHCDGCQVMTASAFSLTVMVPTDGLTLVSGELERGGLHKEHRQEYCVYCKSWVLTRPYGFDWVVNLRATTLDNRRTFEPFIETWTSEKLPWATTPARRGYPTVPGLEEYQPLMDAFKAAYFA
jgi:hypothetical protein